MRVPYLFCYFGSSILRFFDFEHKAPIVVTANIHAHHDEVSLNKNRDLENHHLHGGSEFYIVTVTQNLWGTQIVAVFAAQKFLTSTL